MAPTFSEEDSQLVDSLFKLSKKSPKLVKSSPYPAPADSSIIVRSWKMNEFKYYDIPTPFPTLARGIFTVELPEKAGEKGKGDGGQKHRIVARGYDKFFNIGEVPWTTWPSLEAHTAAPYTLSLKSNGCIIFIAALTQSKLLITSKHSIGPVAGSPLSHAQAGEQWLRKYLEQKGRTEEQLATRLWENNWTAVAELCDDSFEEHVLPYTPEKTGLHLHGLNVSTKAFKTLPHEDIDAFADEWGFIRTPTLTLNSIPEVKTFTSEIGKTGQWNGEAVEGFVVRTHVTEPPTAAGKSVQASPYTPGSSFFFKVKFDEPYMMYRDWREVTKSLLSSKGPMSAANLPKSKMKRPETKLYVRWVINEIKRDRTPFAEFTKGKGIIATRERFLKWLASEQGRTDLDKAKKGSEETVTVKDNHTTFQKTIIVPVAIPGCGKTAVSVALAHIFGFGHTQSDDVQAKKAAPVFIQNVRTLLQKHDVVIADKNNHLRQHRQALREVAQKNGKPTRLLALNWTIGDRPQATVHRICGDRILERGENHQTLRADATAAKSHEDVIWMFINTTEELTSSEVDAVVDMDMEEGLEEAVRRAVDGCVRVIGLKRPSDEKIAEALEVVRGYKPSVKKPDEKGKKKDNGARYYGLLAEIDLEDVLGKKLETPPKDADKAMVRAAEFWEVLTNGKRVAKRPHVTVVHRNSLPGEQSLWDLCAALQGLPQPPLFKARLGNVVWNDRVMAVTVDDLEVVEGESGEGTRLGNDFLQGLKDELKERLHITVGTKNPNVPAVEGKGLIEAWRKGITAPGVGTAQSMKLDNVVVHGRIKGLN
ncbi:tRNA ligase 1 [Hypsizygus marmoreus]|uniref:tRNA ligase n=1 Tax=Hypsizygus marmoreus TaxID=39966 RepID=A0A369JDB3_HYPMA|nr:tRNA ligase 1 [Hypsizygus marmoreus]